MVEKLISEKEKLVKNIHECRNEVALLKRNKAVKKAPLWERASGTVDAKKDFIKSQIADIDREITEFEADIELYYNQIRIIDDKLEYMYE